jgi:hypothetical protein
MIMRDEDASLPYPAPTEETGIPAPITSAPSDKTMRAEVLGVMEDESSDGVCEESQDGPTRGVGDLGLTRAIVIDRHLAYIEPDRESFGRGGSTRTAACLCGWKGPERALLAMAADDALAHERALPNGLDWSGPARNGQAR